MNRQEIMAQDVLQWLALYLAEARIEECLLQQELVEKDENKCETMEDEDKCETMEDENWGARKQNKEDANTKLFMSLIKIEAPSFEAQDPLIEVNLRTAEEPRQTKISGLLSQGNRDQLIQLITKYKNCFTQDYHEMSQLSRKLVEHRYPLKKDSCHSSNHLGDSIQS